MNRREERLFYEGYGSLEIYRQALAYYRYERIIQEFAEFCAQILLSTAVHEDRQQSTLTSSVLLHRVMKWKWLFKPTRRKANVHDLGFKYDHR